MMIMKARSWLSLCLVLLPLFLASCGELENRKWADPPLPVETLRALEGRIDIDLRGSTREESLDRVQASLPNLKIVRDPNATALSPDWAKTPIYLHLRQVAAGEILRLVLGANAGYRAEDRRILITDGRQGSPGLFLAKYPTRTIVLRVAADFGSQQEAAHMLATAIFGSVNNLVDPEVQGWESPYGLCGALEFCNDSEVAVAQTPRGHEKIAFLFRALNALLAARPEKHGLAPQSILETEPQDLGHMRRLLEVRVDVHFDGITRSEALARLSSSVPGLQFAVEPELLLPSQRNWPNIPSSRTSSLDELSVSLSLRDVRVADVLKQVLSGDLVSFVRPGYILVTSYGWWEPRLVMGVYPIWDLLRQQVEADRKRPSRGATMEFPQIPPLAEKLLSQIKNEADPDVAAWAEEGGEATFKYLGGLLIINQTPRGHEKMNALLAEMRKKPAASN